MADLRQATPADLPQASEVRNVRRRWSARTPSTACWRPDPASRRVAAEALDLERLAPELRSRRVQVGLDLAWAYTCRRKNAEAVLALMDVERRVPEVIRHNVYARSTISTLLGRARGSAGGHVRALAARNGVAL